MGVIGKRDARPLLNQALECRNEGLEVLGRKLGVVLDLSCSLFLLNNPLKGVSLSLGLRLEAEHDISVHLNKAAVAVIGKTRVTGLLNEPLDGLIVEAEVQHRIHHAGHGNPGARADRQEQGIGRVSKTTTHNFFDPPQTRPDLLREFRRIGMAIGIVIVADFGRDRHTRRNGQTKFGHFRQICALPTEKPIEARPPIGLASTERVDIPFAP